MDLCLHVSSRDLCQRIYTPLLKQSDELPYMRCRSSFASARGHQQRGSPLTYLRRRGCSLLCESLAPAQVPHKGTQCFRDALYMEVLNTEGIGLMYNNTM